MAVGTPSFSTKGVGFPVRARVAVAIGAAALTGTFAWLSTPAEAHGSLLNKFNARYGTNGSRIDNCHICHTTANNSKHFTSYGKDLHAHSDHFGDVETLDSDGDGYTNLQEIQARTLPGYAEDYPGHLMEIPPPATTTTEAPSDLMSQINKVLKPLGLHAKAHAQ